MRPEISAYTAAHETLIVEPSEPFLFRGQSKVGPTFDDGRAWLFAPVTKTAVVHNFMFRDIVFVPPSGLLLRDNKAIAETKYLLGDEQYKQAKILWENVIEQPADQRVVIGANNAFRNYYHWLTQTIPAIHSAFHHAQGELCVALPHLTPWQERTIELLDLPPHSRLSVRFDRQYKFSSVEYSEYLSGVTAFSISLGAQNAFERMKRNAIRLGRPDCEFIYVARTDSKLRVLTNEEELIDAAQRLGARVIVPGQLRIDEQSRMPG
jgi:capsular polysaccharide biosynthesis protein